MASQPAGDPTFIKRLAWDVEGTAAEVVLSSRIADVAGPRMSLRPVEGMPLIHVQIPQFEGGAYLLKRGLDLCVATVALLAFAPVALVIAALIKGDDPGPVFFRQSRVGRDGREFRMLKFRSTDQTSSPAPRTNSLSTAHGRHPRRSPPSAPACRP